MISRKKKWQPTLVFLPGKSHGQRSLAGYSRRGHKQVRHSLATELHISKDVVPRACHTLVCKVHTPLVLKKTAIQTNLLRLLATKPSAPRLCRGEILGLPCWGADGGACILLILLTVTGVLVVIHCRNQSSLLFQDNFSLLNLEFLNCKFPCPTQWILSFVNLCCDLL